MIDLNTRGVGGRAPSALDRWSPVADEPSLRPVEPGDAPALAAIFAHPGVAAALALVPMSVTEFEDWILLSRVRRVEGRSWCATVLDIEGRVAGLFIASRAQAGAPVAQIGGVLAPRLWGTGAFVPTARAFIAELCCNWPDTRLIWRSRAGNGRGTAAIRKLGATLAREEPCGADVEYVWEIPTAG